MTRPLIALVSGILFGAGLAVSGMIDPDRVRAFLDVFGHWDPTLAFVMGGAILPMALAWWLRKKLEQPLASTEFAVPETHKIDRKLVSGAITFGIGWGIAGLCPGPALAALVINPASALLFVAVMLLAMAAFKLIEAKVT